MTEEQREKLAETFRLLGEPNRLRLVVGCLDGARGVGELTEEVGLSQSLVSHHLRLLRSARLLRARRSGRHVLYEIPDCHVRDMLTNIIEHLEEPSETAETEGVEE